MILLQSFATVCFRGKRAFRCEQLQSQLTPNQWVLPDCKNSFYGDIRAGQHCHIASTNVFFLTVFPYSAAISKPCVLWGHAKVEANQFAIIATGNVNFAFPSLQKHRGAKKDNGKMSNLSRRRFETCLGSEQALQQVSRSRPGSRSPRDCSKRCGSSRSRGPRGPRPCRCLPPPPAHGISWTKHSTLRSCIKIRSWSCSGEGGPFTFSPSTHCTTACSVHTKGITRRSFKRAQERIFDKHNLSNTWQSHKSRGQQLSTTATVSEAEFGSRTGEQKTSFPYRANPLKSHTRGNSLWRNYHQTINKIFLNY